MTYTFGGKSQGRLVGVDPRLVGVMELAITLSPQDFMVVEGVRSEEQMRVNYGKGRTRAQCEAAGVPASYAKPSEAKVTWLKDPLKSAHRKAKDGYGKAVDLGAIVNGAYDGNTVALYDKIALVVFQAATLYQTSPAFLASKQKKFHVRWGADWDGDGKYHEPGETDMGHFELVE